MARLPIPGSDTNTWGDILNQFLLVEHNPDGTQKPLPQSSITNLTADLAAKADDSDLANKVDNTRTVNGQPLSSDVVITKNDIGLGNVDNTSDVNKPVSTAQQTAIDAKVSDAVTDGITGVAPSQNAVFDALALKQNTLGYTPENVANKDTDGTLAANSDIKYPSQKATKTYVDTQLATSAIDSTVVHKAGSETITGNKDFTGTLTHNGNAVVDTADSRLSDARAPSGPAGGVLSGTYPNPGFAADMATQAELDAEAAARASGDALLIPKSLVDAKGDLLVATANDTVSRLGVGTDGQVLTADTASAGGVKWVANFGSAIDGGALVWSDSFASDDINQYSLAPASGAAISGGTLKATTVNTSTNIVKNDLLLHNSVLQLKYTAASVTSASSSTAIGFAANYTDEGNYVLARWEWAAVSTDLAIYTYEAGALALPASVTSGVQRPTAGSSLWLRLSIQGDTYRLAQYTSDPDVASGASPAPTAMVEFSFTSNTTRTRHGSLARPRRFGPHMNVPNTTDWSIDDFRAWCG